MKKNCVSNWLFAKIICRICCIEGYKKRKAFIAIAFQFLEYAIRKVQVNQEEMKFGGLRSASGLC
jgi:hypothetical protein